MTTTISQTGTGTVGKCTQGGSRPSVGDAIRTLTLPQAPYADAVHAALLAAGLVPDVLEAGVRTNRPTHPELILRMVWMDGNPALDGRAGGVVLAWSHVVGWTAHAADGAAALLDLDVMAAPELLADAARHITRHGVNTSRPRVPPAAGRWDHAPDLDAALNRFEEAV